MAAAATAAAAGPDGAAPRAEVAREATERATLALATGCDPDALVELVSHLKTSGQLTPMLLLTALPAWAEGRGDVLEFETGLPALPALLVNPGVPSSTAAVYRAYDAGPPTGADRPAPPPPARDLATIIDWLAEQRNDLQTPAVALAPAIGEVLAATAALPGARLTRMSGSGATVFALFDSVRAAESAGRALSALHPDWWIRATVLR
jgi:4-diphosphocytidyl-2-C-methyl-D-erythritol kinase